ncbi:S-layer homology domain-containing protein [Paenibacillus sp. GXUN7292]|uniref:S-layer homology domain-containing protein n=1 Tax=Paenibacillus sp. GXUN7292 TaxID=3422499 RepID=UPI003D7E8499
MYNKQVRRGVSLFLCFLLLTLSFMGVPQEKVLAEAELIPKSSLSIANAGFEKEPKEGEQIPNWTIISGEPTLAGDEAKAGSQSLLASLKAGNKAINMESDFIDIEENTEYTLSAEVLLQTGTMEGLYVYVYDGDGNLVKSEGQQNFHVYLNATTGHDQWNYHERTFKVQPGGEKLKVSLITGNKKDLRFYVDEISVTKRVGNGDFEQPVQDGIIPGWSKTKPDDASSFYVTGDRYSQGSKSLHLTNTPEKFLNVISDFIPVEAGATYTAKSRTWIENGSADMYVRFFDADHVYMGKQAWSIKSGPTDVWFDQYVTAQAPEGAQYAAILFAGSNKKTYSYYIDDVQLLRGEHEIIEEPIPENAISIIGDDLGPQIRKATLMRGAIGKDGEGRDVIYTVVAGAPSIFTVIDLETEKVVNSIPMPDTSGAWSVTMSSDGAVYLGAYNLGLLYRYEPAANKLTNLGHPFATKDSVLYPMAAGKDGIMYGSTYPTAHLYAYNPALNEFEDYGTMSKLTSGERWTRVVAYDEEHHKIYAGVGNVPRLLEYDLSTGAKRDLLPEGFENIVSVYDLNIAGGKLFARKEANNANETFVIDITSGELIETRNGDTGVVAATFTNLSRGVSPVSPIASKIYFAGAGGELFEYDLDSNVYKSLGASIEGAAIAYEFVQLNEEGFPGYSLVGLSGNSGKLYKYNLETGKVKLTDVQVPAEPVNIHEITKGPDGKIYTAGYLQGNLGVYTPSSGESMYLDGIGQGEGLTSIHNKLYLGIYPNASIYEYDPDKPWNRSNADHLNPNRLFTLGDLNQDRPFAIEGAEDLNKLFVGTVPKNGMLGGMLAVYDLANGGEPDLYSDNEVVPDQSILSFAYKDGLLYGGTSIYGGQGGVPTASEAVLFVWDISAKKKVFELVPVPGKKAITALHIGPDGNVWGLANGALFIFDIDTKQVIYSNNAFPNAAGRWIDGSMETGSDGNVYATVGGHFFKVDAQTKEVTVLATGARKLAQDDFGNFYMFTEPESPNLYRYTIPELLLKLTGVQVSAEAAQIEAGKEIKLSLTGILEKGRTTRELTGAKKVYTSSNPSVAAVDSAGNVQAKRAGTVQITVQVTLDGVSVESEPFVMTVTESNGQPSTPEYPYIPNVPEQPEQPEQSEEPEQPEQPEQPEPPQEPTLSFTDISGHWSNELVRQAIKRGIVNGYADGTFRPDREVTRMEFAAMLARALQLEGDEDNLLFADTNAIPAWSKPYVASLVKRWIIGGFHDNTFRPAKQMTRSEAIVMVVRGLQLPIDPHGTLEFADANDVPKWAFGEFIAAVKEGLIEGRGGQKGILLAPNESITRAEAVALIIRMLK